VEERSDSGATNAPVTQGGGKRARAIEKFDAAIEIYRSHGAGVRFNEYVMADKKRAEGSKSPHAEVKPL